MFDFTFNLGEIFTGCFRPKIEEDDNQEDEFHGLRIALKKADRETALSLILAKITNGKNHSSYIYKFITETTVEILSSYGNEQCSANSFFSCRYYQLLDNNEILGILCVRSEKMEKIIVPEILIEMLTEAIHARE